MKNLDKLSPVLVPKLFCVESAPQAFTWTDIFPKNFRGLSSFERIFLKTIIS